MIVLLSGVFALLTPNRAKAYEASLGSLICSVEGTSTQDAAGLGPLKLVVCSFHDESSGAVAQYVGTMLLQPKAGSLGRSFIWIVRGPRSLELKPGDLAQTYTVGGTLTAGTIAPLIPKDGDDVGLFTLGESVVRASEDPGISQNARQPRSDPVATLDLRLVDAPTSARVSGLLLETPFAPELHGGIMP